MKKIIKEAVVFTLILLPFVAVGGYFTGNYLLDSYPEDIRQQVLEQIGSPAVLNLVTALQSSIYHVICGFLGYLLADALGLTRPFGIHKKPLLAGFLTGIVAGVALGMDYWTFGAVIPQVALLYEAEITISYMIACILYGGILEEIMMRWFVMSLTTWLLWKLFWKTKSKEEIPSIVFILANVLSALLFAAGHLPTTLVLFGELTPMILFRCFLLNGVFGYAFGELYRKYGIQYAMVAHMGAHLVSKLIWYLFI